MSMLRRTGHLTITHRLTTKKGRSFRTDPPALVTAPAIGHASAAPLRGVALGVVVRPVLDDLDADPVALRVLVVVSSVLDEPHPNAVALGVVVGAVLDEPHPNAVALGVARLLDVAPFGHLAQRHVALGVRLTRVALPVRHRCSLGSSGAASIREPTPGDCRFADLG